MNPDPDYSAPYVILETAGEHEGHGLTFTIGRGNEICVAAIEALKPLIVDLDMEWVVEAAPSIGDLFPWRRMLPPLLKNPVLDAEARSSCAILLTLYRRHHC